MEHKIALLSVYNKEGIVDFARELIALHYQIVASGGTKRALEEAGLAVEDVAKFVGGEAILGHRVVTISREIAAGLLATVADGDELKKLAIPWIDLVCVDMYPLAQAIAQPQATLASVLESTDIGGPLMLRAAAKGRRIVVCEQADRKIVIDWIKAGEQDRETFIRTLAAKAEGLVASYVLQSARFMSEGAIEGWTGGKTADCLYGENPWMQSFGLFKTQESFDDALALHNFKPVGGTMPSHNNFGDIDRSLQVITHVAAVFAGQNSASRIAIGLKHGNPCGGAVGNDAQDVIEKMVAGNPLAIFGGVVMVNFKLTKEGAETLLTHGMDSGKRVLDTVIAPHFDAEAIAVLTRKKTQKCRMLENPALADLNAESLDTAKRFRYVRGGFLLQSNYTFVPSRDDSDMQVFGSPSEQDYTDSLLAWAIGSTSNSNTITIVKNGRVLANGVGQQARVYAAKLAVMLAHDCGHDLKDSVAYSDSFFPFTDAPEVLCEAGVRTILTSGGSLADEQVIAYCQAKSINLIMIPDKKVRGFFGH